MGVLQGELQGQSRPAHKNLIIRGWSPIWLERVKGTLGGEIGVF
jgi:hypothetical protein